MRSELRAEMISILEELANAKGEAVSLRFGLSPVKLEGIELLTGIDALTENTASNFKITLRGYDYYRQLKAPRAYWAQKNWFPVAVLVASSLVTLGSSLIVVHLG